MSKYSRVAALVLVLCLLTAGAVFAEAEKPAATEAVAEVATEGNAAAAAALSDDLYSFQIQLNGAVYALPGTLADFEANGWAYAEEADEEIKPNQYIFGMKLKNGDVEISASFINFSQNVVKATEGHVGGLDISKDILENGGSAVLPKGIELGKATKEDVVSAYGQLSDSYDGDLYEKMTYKTDTYSTIELYVYKESKVLEKIEIRNFVPTEPVVSEVSDEAPESVTAYQAPTELGTDLLSFVVEYDGALYRLPAPVKAFEENGWVITEGADEAVSAKSTTFIEMRSANNQVGRFSVYNDSDKAVYPTNCLVTSLKSSAFDPDVAIELPGGITRESTLEEFTAAYAEVESKTEESSSFVYYTYGDSSFNGVTISYNVNDKAITTIEVEKDAR